METVSQGEGDRRSLPVPGGEDRAHSLEGHAGTEAPTTIERPGHAHVHAGTAVALRGRDRVADSDRRVTAVVWALFPRGTPDPTLPRYPRIGSGISLENLGQPSFRNTGPGVERKQLVAKTHPDSASGNPRASWPRKACLGRASRHRAWSDYANGRLLARSDESEAAP
ncbi:hypothetical protein GCM10026982_46000 [Nocardiopsis aegyptia]